MSDIWVEVRTDDSCMWQLKGRTWNEEPNMKDIQEALNGDYEFMPSSMLLNDVISVIVHDEGLLRQLPVNHLASQQLNITARNPIFGNAVFHVEEEFITKEYWFKEEE